MATAGADVTGDDTATTGASNASNGENNFNSCKVKSADSKTLQTIFFLIIATQK
jgi:hypothetical protein